MSARRAVVVLSLLAVAGAVSACGGASHGSGAIPATPAKAAKGTGSVTFIIDVPPPATQSASSRKPQYLSPATRSMSFVIDNTSTGQDNVVNETVGLTTSSTGCSSTLVSTICTLSIPSLIPDSYAATITTYDQPNGAGNVLSANQAVAFTIVAGTNNDVTLTLSGVPVSTLVTPGDQLSVPSGGGYTMINGGAHAFIAESLDADDKLIVGPGAPLFTISSTGSLTAAVSPSTTTSSAPNNFTVTPPTSYSSGTMTVTATPIFTSGYNGCSASGANCTGGSISLSMSEPSLLFVANYDGNTVTEYNGDDWSAAPATISTDVSQPDAVIVDSSGDLFVANYGGSTVTEYPVGNYTTGAPVVISTDVAQPYALAFDSEGDLFVANHSGSGNGTVTEYPVGDYGTASPTVIETDVNLPDAMVFDSAGDLFVANGGNGTMTEYPAGDYETATPTVISSGLNDPDALAIDSSGDLFAANLAAADVTEYSPASYTSVAATITIDVDSPYALTLDSSEDLFVADLDGNHVSEYPVGDYETTTPTLLSVASPRSIALDNYRDVFVGSDATESVDIFPVGEYTTSTPTEITTGISHPDSLALYTP